jgi:maleamate amidohydrolase
MTMSSRDTRHQGQPRVWDDFITDEDRIVFAQSGYGAPQGFGRKPCVLVVDVTYGFVGDESLPARESNRVWPDSCGERGWAAVESIRTLLEVARKAQVPVVHTTGVDSRPHTVGPGRWADKNDRWYDAPSGAKERIVEGLVADDELVIAKGKPSAFFGSQLASVLVDLGVDSLIVVGTTTSGCVRATVVDGFSLNYKVSVVEECTFDRGEASHAINLFDMNLKYADVVSLEAAVDHLQST